MSRLLQQTAECRAACWAPSNRAPPPAPLQQAVLPRRARTPARARLESKRAAARLECAPRAPRLAGTQAAPKKGAGGESQSLYSTSPSKAIKASKLVLLDTDRLRKL